MNESSQRRSLTVSKGEYRLIDPYLIELICLKANNKGGTARIPFSSFMDEKGLFFYEDVML